jgi:23S rRNA pseudouridine1911/1915/1917 synthase
MRRKPTQKIVKPEVVQVSENSELLAFLLKRFPERKKPIIKKVMGGGQILIGKQIIKAFNHPLKAGDTLTIHWLKPPPEVKVTKFNIIHEDDEIIVISKVAGLLAITDNKAANVNAFNLIKEYLKEEYDNATLFLVHRLDKAASGLLVFAKTLKAQKLLQAQIEQGTWYQEYTALTDGAPSQKDGEMKHWLTESKALIVYAANFNNKGQEAITDYLVKKESNGIGVLKLVAKTHRKNQVRAQLQAIGHPILGDKKYGSKVNPIGRLALHANRLRFTHPKTNEMVEYNTNTPTKFKRVL